MKNIMHIVSLVAVSALTYGYTVYSCPQEPAGRAMYDTATTQRGQAAEMEMEMAMEISSMRSAGYTLGECCEVFGAATDMECERIERLYNAAALINN